MALTCNQPTLTAATGCLSCLSKKEKAALLILYLYRQQNPATVGQSVPVATLLKNAACLSCAPSDASLDAMEVWIQRNAAIDAGAAEGTFNAANAIKNVVGLKALSFHQLRAIEISLRCAVS